MARIDRAERRPQAGSAARYPLHAASAGPGGGLRSEQLSPGFLGGRRRHGLGIGCGKSRDRQRASRSSRHQRTGGPVVAGECSGMWFSGRSFLASARFWRWRGCGAGQTSAGEGGGLYRIAPCRKGADGPRGCASRTHPGVRRNEQHQSGFHFAGRAAAKRRRPRDRSLRFAHPGSGPVLHQARTRIPVPKAATPRTSSTSWGNWWSSRSRSTC